jgi:hypothetical protein
MTPRESVGERNNTKMTHRKNISSVCSNSSDQSVLFKGEADLNKDSPGEKYKLSILRKRNRVEINVIKNKTLC